MKLYTANDSSSLNMSLFRSPTSEYRGTPFWSWNTRLDIPTLLRQIDELAAMGMGGFHIHPRVGLATEYLGSEFMEAVKASVARAKAKGMLAWLYDEDRWPSGAAGGLVTSDPQYRMKYLLFTTNPAGAGQLLARYWVRIADGCLAEYRRLKDGENPTGGGRIWHAYLQVMETSTWYNNQTYVDTLSRPAIERFIQVTHERYRQAVGGEFGKTVPAIFTDEPQFMTLQTFATPEDVTNLHISWTTDFAETFRARYGQDILDHLPELFWELPGGRASVARYRYHDHNTERFAAAFADTIGDWCARHDIAFTGHLMCEQTLGAQTAWVGECMRSYRAYQIPGIDLLCDHMEFNTAKQAQSAARQYGREGVLSELYGVTNWDFDFAGHKRQGDWQAALGITVRVHHLAWVSMAGEAKRDYPAAIGWQSPWYREYPLVEDHFARLNTVLTRGKPVTRVGVIHPIESFWLCFGDRESTRVEREQREAAFEDLTKWLLHGLIDFDFISESLLPAQCPSQQGASLRVGQCAYDVVIVPDLRTIRSTTLDRLERFAQAGGRVIFAGDVPPLVDAVPSDRPSQLASRCRRLALTRVSLLSALRDCRDVAVFERDGGPAPGLLYQMRDDAGQRYCFICNSNRERSLSQARVVLSGQWSVELLDTISGESRSVAHWHEDGRTVFHADLPGCGHVLLSMRPQSVAVARPQIAAPTPPKEAGRLVSPARITLSEPNVLLLDQAEFRLDDGAWEPAEEILRIDNALRQRLGWPAVGGGMAQPWTEPASPNDHRVHLRFRIDARCAVRAPRLAIERPEDARITLDGRDVAVSVDGTWTDAAIRTIPLPDLSASVHELVVSWAYGRRTSLEWCYLLGEFGVATRGRVSTVVATPTDLTFGDWTRQGLPFYGGNVTYHCTVSGPIAAGTVLRIPDFRAPLIVVSLNGTRLGPIAFPPYEIELPPLPAGEHRLDLTAFGSRINCFGAVHNNNRHEKWFGPGAYRTAGDNWAYEYRLWPCGILTAPRLLARA